MFAMSNPWKLMLSGGKSLRSLMGYDQRCEKMSSCATQARALVKLIEGEISNTGGTSSEEIMTFILLSRKSQDTILSFLDDCHKADGRQSYHYLTVYKCNVLALLTVDEALRQVDEGAYDSSKLENITKVLYSLHEYLNGGSFCSTITINTHIAGMMELHKLQYVGRGMEYLKKRKELGLYT
jgi:hypothetical protein